MTQMYRRLKYVYSSLKKYTFGFQQISDSGATRNNPASFYAIKAYLYLFLSNRQYIF